MLNALLINVIVACVFFVLGYYVAGHPTDTRNFFTRLADRVRQLFEKKQPTP